MLFGQKKLVFTAENFLQLHIFLFHYIKPRGDRTYADASVAPSGLPSYIYPFSYVIGKKKADSYLSQLTSLMEWFPVKNHLVDKVALVVDWYKRHLPLFGGGCLLE